MLVDNGSNKDLLVVIERPASDRRAVLVGAKGQFRVPTDVDECVGDSIRVQTTDGELVGRVGEPACPDALLTITTGFALVYEGDR